MIVFKEKNLRVFTFLGFFLILFALFLLVINYNDLGKLPLIFHLDPFLGVNLTGSLNDFVLLIVFVILLFLINIFLMEALFFRERILAYLILAFNFFNSLLFLLMVILFLYFNS